ncbi:uncharacterized protein LOC134747922 [Cydia strobilella]|uniref:uncharacterized protein LOC134747922 n=1 Tax=Cydia strobilella TaxID=1100964 RepID=UPI0030075021
MTGRKGMFHTPPHTTVKTRGALEREKLKHATDTQSEVHSHKSCPRNSKEDEIMDHASQFNAKALSLQVKPTAKEGSIKTETEHGYHRSNSSNKTSTSSLQAKRKQLELEAAEAKARIEKELIDKKLDAALAKLDEEYSQKSRCSGEQRSILSETSQKVEQWLEKSRQDDQDERVLATPWQESNPGPSSLQNLAQAMEKLATTTQSANTRLLSRLATSKDLPLFSGHGKETCPAASCDIDSCGLPHHRLLHWPYKPNADSAAPRNSSNNEDLNNTPTLTALGRPLTADHALTTVLYERPKPAAEICNACTPSSIATPADVLTARRETHTCTDADTHSSPQWSSDVLSDSADKQLHELVRRSFALESIGVNSKPRVNKDDIRAVNIIDNSAKVINGSYEVCLPWKNDAKLPDSYPNAYKRLLAVERRMLSDEGYASRYTEPINHLLENNYARLLSDDELLAPYERVFYLAHFGVDNKNKKKLRLVHDASATTAGRSLNDYLLQGPDLLQSLLGIMLRFREKPIAIMGDIKEFFLRIKITREDQHALRFLWRENVNSELKTYVMTSLLFGTNCSPFIAQHIKNKNAMRFQNEMPQAVEAILKSHYMDDYIESVDNEQLAIKMIKEVSEIHKQGGFEIRNWISNKPEVLECTPKETLSDKAIRFKTGCDDLPERTLGLLWYPTSDTFGFDLSLKRIPTEIINLQRKPTKRELLRIYMSIFDIFGFLAPFTVKAKIMLRNIWRTDTKWDDEIPTNEYTVFRNWITELQTLKDLRIPRFYFHGEQATSERDNTNNAHCNTLRQNETTIELELHIFCDAAPTAYAAVAYWRKICNINEVQVSFIASKCRSTPVKKYITIPKLEMESAVIACRLADTIAREHRLTACTRYFASNKKRYARL